MNDFPSGITVTPSSSLAPDGVKRAALQVTAVPSSALRLGGLAAACLGVAAVWLIRR